MTIGENLGQKRWGKHLIWGGITLLCLFIFIRQLNFTDVLEAFTNFHWPYLILGLILLAFGYAMRIIRWSMMLKATGADATFRNCSAPFLVSIALNNVFPLRVGDVVRALVFPKSMGITKTTAISSLIVERLIDLVTLLASLAIGLFAIQAITIPYELKATAVTLASIGGVALTLGFLFSGVMGNFFDGLAATTSGTTILNRIYKTLGELLNRFNVMSRPKVLLVILIVSTFVWIGEAGLFYFILRGTGLESSPMIALLIMAMATLSTLVPSAPGYVGPFHLAAFTAISLLDGTVAQAGSYAIIVHLAVWIPTTLSGVLAIYIRPDLFSAVKS